MTTPWLIILSSAPTHTRALDPSQPDPFTPSNFDKDTMDFIPASSPKHVPLSVEERAQLDLLKILGKAGVSLQTQDTIIDWVCHYSHVNKLHNGGEDFWIRRTFPGREPFLNDLAEKVGTTGHSLAHHIGCQAAVPQRNRYGDQSTTSRGLVN